MTAIGLWHFLHPRVEVWSDSRSDGNGNGYGHGFGNGISRDDYRNGGGRGDGFGGGIGRDDGGGSSP